jgi:dihydroorotate dehydrogenase
MYKSVIRPFLFKLSPEKAHHFTFSLVKNLHRLPGVAAITRSLFASAEAKKPVKLWGLEFPNRVGLAAGFDKDGKLFEELANYGFGFIEVGTVTPKPQPGNLSPRLFRLPADGALINRMGFNNEGVDALVERLKKRKNPQLIVGGNIGKNKDTPNEKALDDYMICFTKLHAVVDYFAVNVSSPNTPNLRDLQDKEPLKRILKALVKANKTYPKPKPILLKIAPDLSEAQLDDIIEITAESKIDGLIATNTTISRAGLKTSASEVEAMGNGGLSGKPVRERATEVIAYLSARTAVPIIAVGGIFNAADAQEKIKAGAQLVQVYTGFIYEGPAMVKNITKGLG